MNASTYQRLLQAASGHRSGFIMLLDPEKRSGAQLQTTVEQAVASGVDAFFVGGTLLHGGDFDRSIADIKQAAGSHPVIIFPGSLFQISRQADAILFLSLISGRNPEHLIGNQATAAPVIWKMGLEAISCGYMLIESGAITSAEFVSNSTPIPRSKPGIALAHAQAAQLLGMKCVYLEAGSGARQTVPAEMIRMVSSHLDIPVIVGGGIRSPEAAAEKTRAGADFVVVGNFFEEDGSKSLMSEFADAIHNE